MSWLSKGVHTVVDPVLGYGSSGGVQNPFQPPDLKSILDLTSKFKPIDTTQTDSLFQDLLKNINAPSSVDQVQSGIDSQTMQQLLENIDKDTANQVGSLKSDFLDRGLSGPGMISDIEAASLGNLRAGATNAKANARLGFANSELARQKAKEDAATAAYGTRYTGGLDTAKTNAGMYNDLLSGGNQTLAKLMTDLYTGGQKNQIDTMQPGYLDNILRNIKVGFNFGGK